MTQKSQSHDKIILLRQLPDLLRKQRENGVRIILCHGVFDLLHIGHIRYLYQAKECGGILVVTVTPDRFVDKGPGRPAFSEQFRAEALAALECVDYVAINEWPSAEETLRLIRPDFYVKGSEFKNLEDATGKIAGEARVAAEIGAELKFVEDVVFSSSRLINTYFSTQSKATQEYLDTFRNRFSTAHIAELLDSFHQLSVCVIGDTIIDDYVYCHSLGVSSKDPVLAVLRQSEECFAGGAVAVANHIAQHVEKVVLCTVLGDDDRQSFIQQQLAPNVEIHPVIRPGAPTVLKKRIMDKDSLQKLIEVYDMDSNPLPSACERQLESLINIFSSQVDMVVSADFGNGCITPSLVYKLCGLSTFLAVNTQSNAGNRGLHTIGRYSRADFISLAKHEILLEYRNKRYSVSEMMLDLQERMNTRHILVTEGRQGCAVLSGEDFQRAPAFTTHVVDRVGAGDSLFSLASLASFCRFPPDLIAFLGNIAGALAVERIGNAKAVSRYAMDRFITAVLK